MEKSNSFFVIVNTDNRDRVALPWKNSDDPLWISVLGRWLITDSNGGNRLRVVCSEVAGDYYFTVGWSKFVDHLDIEDPYFVVFDVHFERVLKYSVLSQCEKILALGKLYCIYRSEKPHCLALPATFVEHHQMESLKDEYLSVLSINLGSWEVKLQKINEKWMFTNRWSLLLKNFPIHDTDLLYFSYLRDRTLQLRVFECDGFEVLPNVLNCFFGLEYDDQPLINIDSDDEYDFSESDYVSAIEGFWSSNVVVEGQETDSGTNVAVQVATGVENVTAVDEAEVNGTDDEMEESLFPFEEVVIVTRERLRLPAIVVRLMNVESSLCINLANLDGSVVEYPARMQKSGYTYRYEVAGWKDYMKYNRIRKNFKCYFEIRENEGYLRLFMVSSV